VGEVQYRTPESIAERRAVRHLLTDSRRSKRDSERIDGHIKDGWAGNPVTALEQIDFTEVAARPGEMNRWIFARGLLRQPDQIGGSRAEEMRGGAGDG